MVERSPDVEKSITPSQAALPLSDLLLSDHTINVVSTGSVFSYAR